MAHGNQPQQIADRSSARAAAQPPTQRSRQFSPQLLLQRAYADPSSLTATDVKHLQRTVGNRATIGILSNHTGLQAKLKLGPAGDKYEQEADRTAQQVVRQMDRPQTVQRHDEEEELQMKPLARNGSTLQRVNEPRPKTVFAKSSKETIRQPKPPSATISRVQRTPNPQFTKGLFVQRQEEEDELQMKPMHGPEGGAVEQSVEQQIQTARGGGKPLDNKVRGSMEKGFGADFSGVRVHTGGQADALNRSLNAKAFTVGNDVFFGKGQYNPGSSGGKQLLAHELTHTVQQGTTALHTQRSDADPAVPSAALASKSHSAEESIQRRIGFEIETGLPVMHEVKEDTKFNRLDNDDLEAPFPGGKLMVDHLPNHEPTKSEPFEEWNILEFVTNPVADDLTDNQFEGIAETWIDNLQQLRDFARGNFDYINYAPNVGAPKYPATVIGRPAGVRSAYPAARWNRVGPQATMGVKLSKVSTALANTSAGNKWAGTKFQRVQGAHEAGPAADKIINKLQQSYPPTQGRNEGIEPLRGLLTLIMNYLLSGKATGTAGYIKNRSTFMYKSKLSGVRNDIVDDYYADKILRRYGKRRQTLRTMILKEAGVGRNSEVYKGATFPSDSTNLVKAGVWLDEVLAGTEDRLFESMKNPWSNEIAAEDIHGETGAVMEMRDFEEIQVPTGNLSLDNEDAVVNVLLQVYRLNRQWATG